MPGVARIVASQLAARFPYGMLSISLLLYMHDRTGSYAVSGAVLAAMSIGQAIAGPLSGRLMSVFGMRPVLLITVFVASIALAVMTAFDLLVPVYVALGFVVGVSMPPVSSAVRTIYPTMVNAKQLTPLYSLDASAQELIWVVGPVLATFAATGLGGIWAMSISTLFLFAGGLWFISSPEVAEVKIPRPKGNFGSVLKKPSIQVSAIVGFLLVGAYVAVEAGTVTAFGKGSPEGGIVLAICSIGSLIGGLTFGHWSIRPWTLARRMIVVTVGIALAMASLNFWWLSLMLFISGIGIAPTLAAMSTIVSSSVKFSDTAEAFGWIGSGQLVGAALGSAIAGLLIDTIGPIGAFVTGTVFAVVGLIVPAIWHRSLPDLKGKDATPHPESGAIAAVS